MIFEQFLKHYRVTDNADNTKGIPDPVRVNENLVATINELGGKTFDNGIYRVLTFDKAEVISKIIWDAFPGYKNKVVCFGVDWLGRCFAVKKEDDSQVLFFDPGAGEVFVIPADIIKFHNYELISHANSALACEFYKQWQGINNRPISLSECVGYKVPLFLGGSDTVDNLEITDLEVYIEICGQLKNKTAGLPEGTRIKKITIS